MELFERILSNSLTITAKSFILDSWQGSEYVFGVGQVQDICYIFCCSSFVSIWNEFYVLDHLYWNIFTNNKCWLNLLFFQRMTSRQVHSTLYSFQIMRNAEQKSHVFQRRIHNRLANEPSWQDEASCKNSWRRKAVHYFANAPS